ncbi:MAG: SDR family NAD(P)-dependent oxidoreductase [Pseudomonadota bacterium]
MTHQEVLRELTESYLKASIADASESLGADFDAFAPFGELGINSFYVLKIIKKLEADFGTLPKSLLFENFNIHDLAGYFLSKHAATLEAMFAKALQGGDRIVAPAIHAPATVGSAVETAGTEPTSATSDVAPATEAKPLRIAEADAHADPELRDLVQTLFARHKIEGCVSRGTRKIAPYLFFGAERKGFFNYSRNRELLLVYGYTGPRDYLPTLVGELQADCAARGLQLNLLCDEPLPQVNGVEYTATPFGVLQRIVDLRDFSLEGGAMRRLRYQVGKFEKAGDARTVEYRCGSDPDTDRAIADIIDRWCAPRTMVNPLIHDVRAEILAGALGADHRLFLTRLDGTLQNAILITEMSGELNGYLMDLEFYPPEMPLGGLEFAIANIISILAAEGRDMLSLGGTYGCKLEASPQADPQLDAILDELREQKIFNDEGNLQFKNKFRPENRTIFLCRASGAGRAENVIDIIMMIADPLKAQVAETFDAPTTMPLAEPPAPVAVVEAPSAADGAVLVAGEPRSRPLAEAGFNPANLARRDVEFDLRTDSWAQLDTPSIEAHLRQLHAQLQQPANLEDALRTVFPYAHHLITDSGKAAEHAFFKAWPKKGVVLQNLLFPSTIFHQIDKGYTVREIPCAAALQPESDAPWKGEVSIEALRAELARDPGAIAMVCIEVCDNATGGAAVSVRHLREVRALLASHAIPLVLDTTRIVENARLVVEQEPEFAGRSVWTVVREILSCADVAIGSLTKDFCVGKGGIVATNDAALYRALQEIQQAEGGGLDAIDLKAIAVSLQNRNRIETRVLRRIEEVRQVAHALQTCGVPVAQPIGGHCVLIDVKRIAEFRDLEHPVASLLAWIYLDAGVRAGAHSVGMQQRTPINDLVRLAIPVGLRQGEVDALIERLVRSFERKRNLPDLALEPGAQATGNLHVRYRLKGYRHPSGALTTLSSDAAARPGRAATAVVPESAPKPSETVSASPRFDAPASVPQAIEAQRAPVRSRGVAVVGMAGRYPKAQNQSEFWDNLSGGRDCIGDLPSDRLERRKRHEDALKYRGGFIDGIDRFDSLFFNISPREAEMLDPQERLFLEVAWEAIEDAGYYPELLAQEDASRNIGVFVGAVWAMYQMLGVEERHAGEKLTPNSFLWSVANRVSYWMNFSGPSLTLDTACSSSLTAAYLACEAILNGECSGAIVGGVNLDLHQAKYDINFNGGALSADGLCRSFGKGANGYVAGEGVGALFLKPLERAERDGDHIYGVIRSAVVNHGGRTSGYTVPNPKAQSNLISAALDKAGIDARTIGYIEAHGTGTELGDPIEIAGLDAVFKAHGAENGSCAIGSVKSNIGHLEAAAGVVGIAKVLLQMKHRRLVPSLHSAELNEFIDFADSPFRVQQTLEAWAPKTVDGVRHPLRAGISSFGAGGSNAHVIVEHYEPAERVADSEPRERIFPLSARTEEQLREVASRLRAHLERESPAPVDLAHTLRIGRRSFDHRLAIVATTLEELSAKLAAFLDGRKVEDIVVGNAKGADGVTRLLNRREKEEFVRMLSQRRDPRKVAALWAEGLLSDWQGYAGDGEGRRVSLPTYPFADKRHWVGGGKAQARRTALPSAGMHPMVDANESTFERQIFRKTFHERDFFIYDHLVADIPTLPGVAYLEFARKAGELAAGRKVQKIRNILWISPIAVQNGGTRDVFIELKPAGESVQFEVFSFDEKGGRIPHSQGRLIYATRRELEAPPEYIDIAAIRGRVERVIDGPTAYPLFKSLGLDLGPSFQVLQEVYRNDEETFGVLRLPEFRRDDLADMPLHPSLVDGSLQAGMGGQLGQKTGEMFVPFSIGEVEILHPLESDCYSYVTEVKDGRKEGSQVLKTNVFIADAAGRVLVKIRESTGVPLRDVHKKPAADVDADGFSRLFYRYDWNPAPLPADADAAPPGEVVFFDRDPALRDLYAQRCAEAGVESAPVLILPGEKFERLDARTYRVAPGDREHCALLFASLQAGGRSIEAVCFAWPLGHAAIGDEEALRADLATGPHAFLAVCQGLIEHKLDTVAQTVYLHAATPEDVRPQDEAIGGFIKALQLEHPKFLAKTLEVRDAARDDARLVDALTAELRARVQDATAVRWRDGERSVRKLRIFDGPMPVDGAVGLREGGVYLITGGAGGLGLLFADHLAREYRAKLVLTGRSQPTPELEAKLDALRETGAEVLYVAADIATRAGAEALIAETRARFGAIHGILHAAGVIRDSFVRNKTAEEMAAVLAPKVFGTLHLDEASRDEPLDFFVAFSSLAGVAGNAGQCDYSYANHFMDSFAALRETRRAAGLRAGRSLSINWSLWADGGMKLDEQTEIYFKKTLGIKPLGTVPGLDAFATGIVSDLHQFAALEGVQDKVELAWGLRRKTPPAAKAAAPAPTVQGAAPGAAVAAAPAAGGGDLAARLQDDLSKIVMDFLKLDAADVATDKILLDLGFDSIGLTTFANAINDKYGLDITPVLFFDYPSLGEISKHLAAERGDELAAHFGGGAPAAPVQAPASPVVSVEPVGDAVAPVEFRKGWTPDAFDREPASSPVAAGFDARARFMHRPIAIVGMSGVMPMSDDLDAFWENLKNSTDMISVVPPDRWRWEDYFGDPLKEVNKSNSKWGGFMNEVDKFDPFFFGISPREAQMMDPQQRIFLETVWKAVEDSGQKVSDLSGTRTGVFVGVATNDYIDVMSGHDIPLDGYSASGNSHSVLANRISFLLNLRGPSAPIDTACSSSLVALHRAVESLHTESCDMAIVGGVHVMLSPAAYISFSMAGMLSPDGRCKTFDKRANGYVRGEGSGAIFLKHLSAAEADGNHIYAVIRATAENHGGKVTTLTAPNSAAQAELLVEAYDKAGIDPTTVGYIECHGTGTSLGDPIEIQALTKAFAELYKKRGKPAPQTPHCGLSSVKTNIGHLETAAGIAGLLKVLLSIKHKHIPANLHFEEVNPYINLKGTPFFIAERLTPWSPATSDDGRALPRRAGVSSFGFGGANAHIVLEEYIAPARAPATTAPGPQLIVLSAKSDERLRDYAGRMRAHLQQHDTPLDDFARTLQVGRDEMAERLALVVSNTDELVAKFGTFAETGVAPAGGVLGNVRSDESKARLVDEAALRAMHERRDLPALAEQWASGARIDWRALHDGTPLRRLSLPTYPFARDRYWMPVGEGSGEGRGGRDRGVRHVAATAVLHPLVQRNVSTLEAQTFATAFAGDEFYFEDHRVRTRSETQKILPGVAYIEMARMAGELSANAKVRVVRNLIWERPVVIGDGDNAVEIVLAPARNEVKFSVRSAGAEPRVTHCSGRLAYAADGKVPERLDIGAICERCREQVVTGEELYAFLEGAGLLLGPSFRIVQSIHATAMESLSVLRLPEHLRDGADAFCLHPALMDGSLHTAIGLMKQNGMEIPMSVPYSVGEVRILHPLDDLHYGYATWAVEDPKTHRGALKVDFHLLDRNGRVLVRMKDFVSMPYQAAADRAAASAATSVSAPAPAAVAPGLQPLVPVWNPLRVDPVASLPEGDVALFGGADAQFEWLRAARPEAQRLALAADADVDAIAALFAASVPDHLVWVAPDVGVDDAATSPDPEALVAAQEQGVVVLFRTVKALLQAGHANRRLQWTLVVSRTQRVTARDRVRPAHAGVVGLVGSLAKEYPQWELRLLDIDGLDAVSAGECLAIPADRQGDLVAHRGGEWFRQSLALAGELPAATPVCRDEGVYVVIGGAGGVGEVWSREMIVRHRAQIVWIGRRPRDAAIDAKIEALAQLGPAPMYLSADATDPEALAAAAREVLDAHSAIHGVVHSAIVLQDQSLARMDEATFRASLAAKVDVCAAMTRAFGGLPLDFMLFFSSVVSFVKSAGQANYAAGCTFKDSFALHLDQTRDYAAKTINWGYWGSVGIVADESYNKLMEMMGIGSIEPDEGMACLRALMDSATQQLALIKTRNAEATAGLGLTETLRALPVSLPPLLPRIEGPLLDAVGAESIADLEAQLPTDEMNDLVTELLAAGLIAAGVFRDGVRRVSELPHAGKAPPAYYERWLDSSLDQLRRQGFLADGPAFAREVRDADALWALWTEKRAVWGGNPNLNAQLTLMEVCLRALPDILLGRRPATDVMFPNSSMALVEGIYRGNAMADYFNEVLGRTLVAAIECALRDDPAARFRIVEIGAGTGGTTARLLPMLEGLPIDEYCYTDVSRAFLMYAEKHYKPQLPALTTALFDVTRPLAGQPIEPGRYDFAVATNVLHATPNIRETLRNTKAALKREGVLLANEISEWALFSHLTFGLLEGWWLHEDTGVRIPGSPGLSQAGWRDVLVDEGFDRCVFPTAHARRLGQQVIAAASDGLVRQRIVAPAMPASAPPSPEKTTTTATQPKSQSDLQARPAAAPVAARTAEHQNAVAARSTRTMKGSPRSPVVAEQAKSDFVQKIVVDNLSQSLQMDAGKIRADYPFADYGVDSIVGVNLVRTISETLQIELETTSLFEYSTVQQLSKYILTRWPNEVLAAMGHGGGSAGTDEAGADFGSADFESADFESADTEGEAPTVVAFSGGRFAAEGIVVDADAEAIEEAPAVAGAVEPIAIVGMSGRFAESDTLDAFWENLRDGRHLVKPVTRWAASDCIFAETGQEYCSAGSFIEAIDRFDPDFFGISAVEATYMDPQHRLFLEESWKALEDAGYGGDAVHEKQCGVYVGCGSSNYESLFAGNPPPQAFWGNSEAVIPARIAYHLNLQGPAIAIDTACSSSLVAIHLACQGLWSRETEMALAGGVFLQATPGFYHVANRAGMLSPDGVCRSFDAGANGFVPGEGVGAVVLKRLRDALRDGDHVHGVVIGSGINQDGSSNGLIAPNARAQERLERSVYDRFGIDPSSLQAVEAHGTGTLLGDSIEYAAIHRAFREYTDRKGFCAIGTVKTNIGHAATAAGVAGVLKLLLAMRHRQIPPSLHYRQGNPAVDFESGPFYVNTALKDWTTEDGRPRRAAISGFGFSGTNAHLVLEEAPEVPRVADVAQAYLLALSARTAEQLRAQARNLLEHAKRTPGLPINDVCYSLLVGRTAFAHRLSCTVRDREDLIARMEQWLSTGVAHDLHVGEVQEGRFREQTALKKFGNYCVRSCVEAPDAEDYPENLSAIGDLFVQGYALDYAALFAKGSRRLPLPTYPFADGRYWVETAASPSMPSRAAVGTRLHPLLHVNASTLAEQRFETTFDGKEPFLRDHADEGERVVPAMILLEMTRVALEKALPGTQTPLSLALRDVVWADPPKVSAGVSLAISLFAVDDDRIDCEIHAGGDGDASVVHLQTRAVRAPAIAPARLPLDALRAGLRRVPLGPDDIDAALSRAGVQVGPVCRALTDIHQGERQLLARLATPSDGGDEAMRQACLLTGALQAGARLIDGPVAVAPRTPAALGQLRFFAPCGEDMYAWVRHARNDAGDDGRIRLDIDLVDADGRICVQMHELTFDAAGPVPRAQDRAEWRFHADPAEDGDAVAVPMSAEDKIALFVKQEAALLLDRRVDDVPMTLSYFDLGLSSLALANLIRKTNALLGEQLSPSALFEYRDIRSLSSHLAGQYAGKIDALRACRRSSMPTADVGPRRRLTPLPRVRRFDPVRAEAAPATVLDESVIDRLLWRDTGSDESYDKVTF